MTGTSNHGCWSSHNAADVLLRDFGFTLVMFDTPVSREYLGEIGVYAAFGSVPDLAAKLRQALERREWAAGLGALGRERAVRELSSDRAGPQIAAIYDAALAGRCATAGSAVARRDDREEAIERGA